MSTRPNSYSLAIILKIQNPKFLTEELHITQTHSYKEICPLIQSHRNMEAPKRLLTMHIQVQKYFCQCFLGNKRNVCLFLDPNLHFFFISTSLSVFEDLNILVCPALGVWNGQALRFRASLLLLPSIQLKPLCFWYLKIVLRSYIMPLLQ